MTAVDWWVIHAQRAALDRFATGRHLDREFVADLESHVAAVVEQTGGDRDAAMFAVHMGLYSAHAIAATGEGRPGWVERLEWPDDEDCEEAESA